MTARERLATRDWFPDPAVLQRLAVSETGFIFDPVSGQSFSTGETGVAVLKLARNLAWLDEVIDCLTGEYDAPRGQIERDLQDFAARLKELIK
ncbi:coenzyme PQQ synthesis protein D (PqqD) [Fluviicoccus keumensis]|uniref:Coenzyme PQQ synthesis protein D (PqqD) n=1 Tax=Fluviicoccus keumensis TaxID=1435465 RepID=A0A4Q7ZA01_9GAMM|nr:PqqD family protein [Fluviicoccus keumensis]RZU47380.1 coenzyme PQQ synthesis protein D (PqqD) [Fluviicoccus keumensis]